MKKAIIALLLLVFAMNAASKDLRCNELTIIIWDEEGLEEHGGKNVKMVPMWKWLIVKT